MNKPQATPAAFSAAAPAVMPVDTDDLYAKLHSLSKSLEGSGRLDEHDNPDAYSTILDAMRLAQATGSASRAAAPFQDRVQPWLMECFGPMIAGDREERNHRLLEEALELVQACDCSDQPSGVMRPNNGSPSCCTQLAIGAALITG